MIDRPTFWLVVVVLGIGTYLIRLSFLGLLGNRPLPLWLVRSLRYTAVAVLPALVAPAILWPSATAGALDPVRLGAIAVTILAGVLTRNMIAAIAAGGVAFYLLPMALGAA
jgi:branched-subunit amino acid transport protein